MSGKCVKTTKGGKNQNKELNNYKKAKRRQKQTNKLSLTPNK